MKENNLKYKYISAAYMSSYMSGSSTTLTSKNKMTLLPFLLLVRAVSSFCY